MTTGVAGGDGAAVISFLRLHYGKLAEGAERRVPPSAGYAVTRRSRGLDPAVEPLLSPSRLTGLRRVEPDAIDVDARGAGCFVARGVGENMVFMRARFRPEDGEGGFGRLHQQSAIWVTAFDAWRGHPAGCLSVAAEELRALPDLVGEAEAGRLDDAPLRWRVASPDPAGVRRVVERAPWGLAMLEMLVDGAERGGDALMDFGAHDFVSERDFLAAVGFVLQLLPAAYPRWRDVAVVSGLTHALPGLCLRYAPSWRRVRAAA